MFEGKPGAADGPRDRKTHYRNPYDQASRDVRTFSKKFWGVDLSKKEQAMLDNSSNDSMAPKLNYSLNKRNRWEIYGDPEMLIEEMASRSQAYPIGVAKQGIVNGAYVCKAYSQKNPTEEGVKSVKVKTGNGAPFLSLHDSIATEKPERKEKLKKGDSAKEYVESPSILYYIQDHHSDDLAFRKLIGNSKNGAWTSKKVKTVNLKDIEEYADDSEGDDSDFDESDGQEASPKQSSLADFIISKPEKSDKKRRINNDFEIINDISKLKISNKNQTLPNISQLASSSISQTRYINIDTDSLKLPSFETYEFMFDFMWLNEEKSKCLFTIPKGTDDAMANISSLMILKLSDTEKHKVIKMTVESVHEIYLPSVSGNPERAHSEIEVSIQKLWQQGINHLNKCKDEPSIAFYQPKTCIFSTFNPMGDFALLDINKSLSKRTTSESDFEKVQASSCDLCSHDRACNLSVLSCGHTFCQRCSEKIIKEQIEDGCSQLCCIKCSIPFEPQFILISTPLPLLQAYLRFQFLKQEFTLECPNKCGVAFYDEVPKFGGVQCSKCKSAFCVKCKREPHFPLNCNQMMDWETRFMPQYVAEMQKETPNVSENPEDAKNKAMQDKWRIEQELHSQWAYRYPVVKSEAKPSGITASISSVCIEARSKKLNSKYLKTLIQQFDSNSSSLENAKELKLGVITALHLLEFGFAWIYFSRKYKSLEYKSLKQALHNFRGIFIEMESRLSTSNAKEAMEKFEALQSLGNIIVESFKFV